MAINFTPVDVQSGFHADTALDTNFTNLQSLLLDCFSRSGVGPNTLSTTLDMNSNRLINLPDATTGSEPLTFSQSAILVGGTNPIFSSADRHVQWVKGANDGVYIPAGTTQDIIVTFFRASVQIATHTVRGVLNPTTGAITISTNTTSGENTSLAVTNNTTTAPEVTITHVASGTRHAAMIFSVQGGDAGSGVVNILTPDHSNFEVAFDSFDLNSNISIAQSGVQKSVGTQSALITKDQAGATLGVMFFGTSATDYRINLEAARTWLIIARVRALDETIDLRFGLKFGDATEIYGSLQSPTANNVFQTIAWEVDATGNSSTIAEMVFEVAANAALNDTWYLDGISLVDITDFSGVFSESAFPTAYIPSITGTTGADAELHYIKPITGTAIQNSVGTLTLEAHKITGGTDVLLSTGTIKLFEGATEITVGNGYAAGSDGYTGVFDAGDISGSVICELKDGGGGTILDTITLVDVTDGAAASDTVTAFLTNEVHTVAADPDGTNYSLTNSGGTYTVFQGITDETTNSLFAIIGGVDQGTFHDKTQNGLTFTIQETTGVYSLSGASWTSESETFEVTATFAAVEVHRFYTITKAPAGVDSAIIHLLATEQAFSYDATDINAITLNGPSQIVFTANLNGVPSPTVWTAFDDAGAAITPVSNILTSLSDTSATMTEANFSTIANNDFIRVVATVGAVSDTFSIFRLLSGSSSVVASIAPSNGVAWTRAIDDGVWTPVVLTTDLVCTFYRAGLAIGTHTVKVTLTEATGVLLSSFVSTTGEASSFGTIGEGGTSLQVTFTHTASSSTVSETVHSVKGGFTGVDGVAPFTSFNGKVGAFTTGLLRRNEQGDGTPNDGEIGIDDSVWMALDGTNYDTGGVLTLNTPYESTTRTANQFYVILGATNGDVRFGGGWDNHRFFIAELNSATEVWTAVNNANGTSVFVPIPTDVIVGIGQRASTGDAGIKFLSQIATRMSIDSINATEFIQNAAISEALIGDLSAGKITTGQLNALRLNIDGITLAESGGSLVIKSGGVGTTQIANDAITTTQLAANAVTATEINVAQLDAISANMGTITAGSMAAERITSGNITANLGITTGSLAVSSTGALYSGKTSFGAAADGWWIGRDGGTAKFRFGNAANDKSITWDGTNLTVNGAILGTSSTLLGPLLVVDDITDSHTSSIGQNIALGIINQAGGLQQRIMIVSKQFGDINQYVWLTGGSVDDWEMRLVRDTGTLGVIPGESNSLQYNIWYDVTGMIGGEQNRKWIFQVGISESKTMTGTLTVRKIAETTISDAATMNFTLTDT